MHREPETSAITEETRDQTYARLLVELSAILDGETFMPARFATATCLLSEAFADRFFWTGFYCVAPDNPRELVVGPYVGTLGCLRIVFGKGVCGTVAETGSALIVDDVHAFPGHIACDSRTNSEIVLPVYDCEGALIAVLDIDSTAPSAFDTVDKAGLEQICDLIGKAIRGA